MVDMRVGGCRGKEKGRDQRSPFQMAEATGRDPRPRPCPALQRPRLPTHATHPISKEASEHPQAGYSVWQAPGKQGPRVRGVGSTART